MPIPTAAHIQKLYAFLKKNDHRKFNASVQCGTYRAWLGGLKEPTDRAYTLLFECANSQSRPKLDKLCKFWKTLCDDSKSLSSFKNFAMALDVSEADRNRTPYRAVFAKLKDIDGWGDKTAALFIRHLLAIHTDPRTEELRFWEDVRMAGDDDRLYLPVDRVISECFTRIGCCGTFMSINNLLWQHGYRNNHIRIWDDLWFWGFITQRSNSKGNTIEFVWNEPKYWALRWTDKSAASIKKAQSCSAEFVALFTPNERCY